MSYSAPVRQDLERTLKAAFTYDTLAIHFRNHLARRLDQVLVKEAFDVAVPKLILWAEQNGFERPLVRLMQEAAPNNDDVIAFFQNHTDYPPLLATPDRESLRVALSSVFLAYGDLRMFVQAQLQTDLNDVTGAAQALDTPAEPHLFTLIRWADHFDRIEALIRGALTRFPGQAVLEALARPLLTAIVKRRPSTQKGYEDPFRACTLDGTLFINRAPLRHAIERLSAGANPRVFAVNGPSRSGKSHSLYFIAHIEEKQRKFEKLVVDLKDEAPAKFRPNMLVRSLVRQMGRNKSVPDIPKEEDSSTPARWVRDLADFLLGEIKDSQKLWVIVLDGFGNPNLDELTREMVRELVVRAARESLLRVVLLQYSDDLLPVELAGRFEREPLSAFTKDDLRGFFQSYIRMQGEEPEAAVLDEIVDSIWGSVPAGGPECNEQIAAMAAEWVRKVEG